MQLGKIGLGFLMNELIKKFGAFSIGPVVSAFLGFLTVPVITYFISPEEYGRASMFILAQGTVSMLMYLGMDQAFIREFNKEKKDISRLMSNAIIIPMITVILLDIFVFLNAKFISYILFDTEKELLAVYILAIMFPFMIIENFSLLKIRMEEKGVVYSFFTILLKFFVLILTIGLFIVYEKSFRSVVYALAFAEILNGIILYIVSMSKMNLRAKHIDKKLIVRMLKFGLPLIPASVLGWALTSIDKIMLRIMCSYSDLGLYTAAFKIVSVLGIIQSCFTLFWTPVAYRWYESGVEKSNFENVNRIISFIMTVLCLGILLFKEIVALILGNDFWEAIYVFPFLLLNPIMYTMSEATSVGIGFKRKTYYNIMVSGVSGAVNIILNYLLIPEFAGKGAAIATGISYLVFFWMRTLISGKLWIKFSIREYMLYTVLIVMNCAAHTFLNGYIPYLISAISLCIVIAANFRQIKGVYVHTRCKR